MKILHGMERRSKNDEFTNGSTIELSADISATQKRQQFSSPRAQLGIILMDISNTFSEVHYHVGTPTLPVLNYTSISDPFVRYVDFNMRLLLSLLSLCFKDHGLNGLLFLHESLRILFSCPISERTTACSKARTYRYLWGITRPDSYHWLCFILNFVFCATRQGGGSRDGIAWHCMEGRNTPI